ncbi:DUF3618 domain-containing protein [Elioraea rosea]|uniref:DUF3618 domain-containing protein n=1 Tax=Elioraea rosea TaxID=2492390 RepID=UPI00118331D2|nr:DUF3618 domain-containing protein [Elioraea rosea]
MSATTTHPGGKSADQIEYEVEQTRASVSGTVDALRDKLQPGQIVDEVVDRISSYAKGSGGADFARNLGTAVRDNPLPVLLIGAGIGWLLLSKQGSEPSSVHLPAGYPVTRRAEAVGVDRAPTAQPGGERRSNVASGVGQAAEAMGDAASRASGFVRDAASRTASAASSAVEAVSDAGERLYDAAPSMGSLREGVETARERSTAFARRAADSWEDLAEAQPLLLGVFGVALGAAVGAALPRTRTEDRLMGEARDAVVDRAAATYDEVREVVGEQAEQATQKIKETYARTKEELDQGGTGDSLKRAADDVAETLEETASAVASRLKPGEDEPSDTQTPSRPNARS